MRVKYLNQNKKKIKGVIKKWRSDSVRKNDKIEGCSVKQLCMLTAEIQTQSRCVVDTDYELFSSSKMLYFQIRQQGHWKAVNDI